MSQSFEEFCRNSTIWDLDLLVNSSYPQFTECFQNTLLVWVPCGLVWVLLPFYMYSMFRSTEPPLPWSCLNVSKSILAVVLFLLTSVDLLFVYFGENADDTRYSTAFYLAGGIKAATFLLAALIVQMERRKGVRSSAVLFIFWFLSTLASIVPFYTLIVEKVYKDDLFHFTMFYISFTFIPVQLVLSSFAEKYHYDRYQTLGKPQCPQVYASFPSVLTFWWMTSLIVNTFRSGIDEDQFWELHPRDQGANFLPRFHKAWQEELGRCRKSESRRKHQHLDEELSMDNPVRSETAGLINASVSVRKYDAIKSEENCKKEVDSRKGPSLLKVIVKEFGRYILFGMFLILLSDCVVFLSPLTLNLLIGFVQNKNAKSETEHAWKGYVYAAALFVFAATQTILLQRNLDICLPAAMRIKSALISAVYNKALTMSSEARKTKTQGEIVNLMAVDCQRIQDIAGQVWVMSSALTQLSFALALLWKTLGVSVLSGVGFMILLLPVNALIATRQKRCQVAQMLFKDQRLKLMNEVLNGIKVLKLYAWEPSFEKKVQEIREKELGMIKKNAYLGAVFTFIWNSAPFMVNLLTFATYILISEANHLDAQKAFVSLALFNIIRFPLSYLPLFFSLLVQGQVSMGRLSKFLQAEDLDPSNVEHTEMAGNAVSIENGTFGWDRDIPPTLKDINLDVPEGQLVAVVGQVGAGKSSLVSAILGEMERYEGKVTAKGNFAFVPQQAWIQNNTLRDNILFGMDLDQGKYKNVIDACALQPDLDMLQAGDLTEIGEKGINLSGGQKQRVSLARAVYHNADIYLLDDPLSAVDSHVGKHIFDRVIGSRGLLRNKTRVLVTHGVHWLPFVDQIVVMVNGRISELGSYQELMSHDGAFAQFLKTYLSQNEEASDDDDPEVQQIKSNIISRLDSISEDTPADDAALTRLRSRKKVTKPLLQTISSIDGSADKDKLDDSKNIVNNKLIEAEHAETSKVSWKVYLVYFSAIGGLATLMIFALFIIYQGAGIGNSIWLARWTDDKYLTNLSNSNTTKYKNKNYEYLGVYAAIGLGRAVVIFVYALLEANRTVHAARLLHNGMLGNVMKLPMAFFDTTPLGRILNRFSRDVDTIDNVLPMNLKTFLITFFGALSIFVVISYTTPLFTVILVPMGILYYMIQRLYIPTSRQLQRIESTTRSPIYSHFGETIAGVSTIRAYDAQQRFIEQSRNKVDRSLVLYFARLSSIRWLAVRLDILGHILVFTAAMFAVSTPGNTGGLVGLSISYALQVTASMKFLVRNSTDVETNSVSVERVKEYTEKPTEAKWILPSHRPGKDWPETGNVQFNNYSTRYRDGLDLVLKGISCAINAGERIGIVGRTGAGKSSLTVALFRIIEAAGGDIVIDGERISDMGLHDLRSKLTILPQDPVLFSGSLRMNLDPFDQYTDSQIWQALEHAHLKTFVSGLAEGLGHECGEGGQNLSVGQRQLVCLARTLLRKTKILILDEATAAVDMETDDLIQRTIREEFQGCTVLTIAHRLNTILDYNRILVLDQGLIKEFDSPQKLLENPSSIFHGMAKDANLI